VLLFVGHIPDLLDKFIRDESREGVQKACGSFRMGNPIER
jgi:hypothetical protein